VHQVGYQYIAKFLCENDQEPMRHQARKDRNFTLKVKWLIEFSMSLWLTSD